jgi:UDP-N-acetylmuramyl pentapeptide synthase
MGKQSVELSREASVQRRAPEIISHFLDIGKLSRYLNGFLSKGDAVLIKGSRNMEMWRLLDEIETLRKAQRRRID